MDVSSKYLSPNSPDIVLAKSFHQYEQDLSDISVVGSLARHADYWDNLPAPQYIKNIIRNGYTIPLYRLPKSVILPNNASSRNEPVFVRSAIDELLLKEAAMEVNTPPRVVNPLTVAIKDGKKRLVLDLRHVNRAVVPQKCKIESTDILAQYLPSAAFLYGFDLKSGYHHIDMVPAQWCLLGFSFPDHKGKIRYFVFKVLPFGLSSAGFIFTKVLRVLIHLWRSSGIRIVTFFDDGIGAITDYIQGIEQSKFVKKVLLNAGFIPNAIKSTWVPTPTLACLGFLYDLIKRMVFAQECKLDKIKHNIILALHKVDIHKRKLSSIVGSIVALHLSHGDIVYLRTKRMQMLIAQTNDWDDTITLTEPAYDELMFWLNYMYKNNGLSIDLPIAAAAVSYSDASATGCASIITPCPSQESLVTHREFTEHEQSLSSTYRELVAVYHWLESAKFRLQNSALKWFTDSMNIVSIVRKGSMVQPLLELALEIFHITRKHNITLSMNWISRDLNVTADQFSRIIDHDDWGVDPQWFEHICKIMGPVTIDRFADARNTKTARFNSRFLCPSCEAVDAFTQNWHHDRNWIVPPLYLIQRALEYLILCKAKGILICPIWKAAHYWPRISFLLEHQKQHIIQTMIRGDIFVHYRNRNSIFGASQWSSETLVLSLDFS